jgi:hypothetical protein
MIYSQHLFMKSRPLLVLLGVLPTLFGAGCTKEAPVLKSGAKELHEAAPVAPPAAKPTMPEGTEKIPLPR